MESGHKQSKIVVNRLARLTGHIQSVRRMVEEGRECMEILIQLSAIRSALNGVGRLILEDHIDNCLVRSLESGDREALNELNEAIGRFLK